MTFDVSRHVGDAMEFEGTYYVRGVATPLTGHTLRATLKRSDAPDAADPGVAQVSTVSSASGIITLQTGGGVANAGYLVHFNAAATASLTPDASGNYPVLYMDVRIVQPDGDPFVIDPPAGQRNVIRLFGPVTQTRTL